MPTTAAEIVAAHRAGRRIAETIAEAYARFEAHADPALFLSIRPIGEALAAAERLQAEGPEGKPLWGVPFVVKDNIDVAGLPTTAACPAFAYTPARSAYVVERLEAAGAIPLAKTNLDQFATGLVGVRSPYGVPRNALDAALIPGGSSSGSATAVGAGLVPFSLGTDTAGSGRVPAALNGIVGLKPSLGALSARGLVPACRTLDTISIFALDVADAFAAFCGGQRLRRGGRLFPPLPRARPQRRPPHARLAVPRADQLEFFGDALSERAFAADLARLRELGFRVEPIDFAPFAETARLLYEGPWVAERYAATKPLIVENPDALHPVTRAILESASKFDAVATFEAFYRLAALKATTAKALAGFDALVVPTLPRPYAVAEVEADPVRLNSRLGTYTNFVNFLDLAAIAVPSGARGDALPSHLTLIGASAAPTAFWLGWRTAIQAASGAPMGATRRLAAPAPAATLRAAPGRIEIVVVGAHLSGLPLNHELTTSRRRVSTPRAHHARIIGFTRCRARFPPKPGLLRVADGAGGPGRGGGLGARRSGVRRVRGRHPCAFGRSARCGWTTARPPRVFWPSRSRWRAPQDVTSYGGWRALRQAVKARACRPPAPACPPSAGAARCRARAKRSGCRS